MGKQEWRLPVSEHDRDVIIEDVVRRVVEEKVREAERAGDAAALEHVINDVLYHEKLRARSAGDSHDMQREMAFLSSTTRRLSQADFAGKRVMLEKLTRHYADDIAGHFSPRIFDFSTRLLPVGLEAVFSASSPAFLFNSSPNISDLQSRIVIRGDIERIKELARLGTIVVTPTHCSNMDSLVVGWALNDVGLPPLNYGAGKNLFVNKILAFFMNGLGAYKVDRRIKHELYKDTLKMYSLALLEDGRHSLFFPGGTRSRSGALEKKLKMGLLGTGLSAYVNNLINEKPKPNIYYVPLTINYAIVLEAETLIDDYLKEVGKSRYIIVDDEFSKPAKIIKLLTNLLNMESSMSLQFGEPMDPLGNLVDEDGVSLDSKGRKLDIRKYVTGADGNVRHDAARDMEYTRELAEGIVASFHRNAVVLSTHVAGFALFEMLKAANPGIDLYRLLRFEGEGRLISVADAVAGIERVISRLLELNAAGKVKLGGSVRPGECGREVLYKAMNFFGMYHTKPVVVRKGDSVKLVDLNLLYYYHNRLTGWGLEELFRGDD